MRREFEGGALVDLGTYCIRAIGLIAGEPLAVYGERVDGGDGIDVPFAGILRLRAFGACWSARSTARSDAAWSLSEAMGFCESAQICGRAGGLVWNFSATKTSRRR